MKIVAKLLRLSIVQGRRRFLKSGTAIDAKGVPRGPKARAGESTRGDHTPSYKLGSGNFLNLICL